MIKWSSLPQQVAEILAIAASPHPVRKGSGFPAAAQKKTRLSESREGQESVVLDNERMHSRRGARFPAGNLALRGH